jgi:hypothetical protein
MAYNKSLSIEDDVDCLYTSALTDEDLSSGIELEITMTNDIFDYIKGKLFNEEAKDALFEQILHNHSILARGPFSMPLSNDRQYIFRDFELNFRLFLTIMVSVSDDGGEGVVERSSILAMLELVSAEARAGAIKGGKWGLRVEALPYQHDVNGSIILSDSNYFTTGQTY